MLDAVSAGDRESPLFHACRREAQGLQTIEDFKAWTRTCLRPLLPHGALSCVYGRIFGVGLALDYVVTIDYPDGHLKEIRNASGHMETPLANRWAEQKAPVFFEVDHPPADAPEAWLASFRKHGLKNAAADGVMDYSRRIATYFSFHQLPTLDEPTLLGIFKTLTPLLHETFARVIHLYQQRGTSMTRGEQLLTEREQEIAVLIGQGKSNADIALLLAISENTVKNHISRILEKTGFCNRVALAVRQEQELADGGAKVL